MKKLSLYLLLPNALIMFILGFIILFGKSSSFNNLAYIIIILASLIGVISLFSYIFNNEYKKGYYLNLFSGIYFIWLCLFSLTNYEEFTKLIPETISIYAMIMFFSLYFEYKFSHEKMNLILSIISLIYSIILILRPFSYATFYTKFAGIFLIINSIYYLYLSTNKLFTNK